jgi:hypothetical protein
LLDTVRRQRRSFRIIGHRTREYIEAEAAKCSAHFNVRSGSVTLRTDTNSTYVASISKSTKAIATSTLTFFGLAMAASQAEPTQSSRLASGGSGLILFRQRCHADGHVDVSTEQ